MGARECGCDPRFNIVCLTHAVVGVPEVAPVVDNTRFERSYLDHLSEMTDLEVIMLGVGLAILRGEAKAIMPEQRYSYPIAKVAEELHIRAMRRF